jgi:hypothetical protein
MKFGTEVWIKRGGNNSSPGTPGCVREIRGVLVGRKGVLCWVRLVEDDPLDTVGWSKTGDVGYWFKSAVR